MFTKVLNTRYHMKIGTPKMGTRVGIFRDPGVPIFTGFWGPPYENGDPQCNTLVGIYNID
jgi:hypothetical protein